MGGPFRRFRRPDPVAELPFDPIEEMRKLAAAEADLENEAQDILRRYRDLEARMIEWQERFR